MKIETRVLWCVSRVLRVKFIICGFVFGVRVANHGVTDACFTGAPPFGVYFTSSNRARSRGGVGWGGSDAALFDERLGSAAACCPLISSPRLCSRSTDRPTDQPTNRRTRWTKPSQATHSGLNPWNCTVPYCDPSNDKTRLNGRGIFCTVSRKY